MKHLLLFTKYIVAIKALKKFKKIEIYKYRFNTERNFHKIY